MGRYGQNGGARRGGRTAEPGPGVRGDGETFGRRFRSRRSAQYRDQGGARDRDVFRQPASVSCLKTPAAKRNSIRGGDQHVGNFDADLAIVAKRAGMKRQEGVLEDVLRDGFRRRRMRFEQRRLVFENRFYQLIDQIVGKIGSPDCKVEYTERVIVRVQGAVRSGADFGSAEFRYRLENGIDLLMRKCI